MSPSPPAVTFINAQLDEGEFAAVRIAGGHIAAIGPDPKVGDAIVDLDGDRLLPGLINAHEHLHLNNLPREPIPKRYRNVKEWVEDINERRRRDPEFEALVTESRDDRLLIGAVKNLLSGVTTVAHHDPLYPLLSSAGYPLGVVQKYGWSHSLYTDGEAKVLDSYRGTPSSTPWIIHAAEGVDREARAEFDRLDELGCIGPNTLLVHGVALDGAQRQRLHNSAAGLVWCPSSNMTLFGRTAEVADLLEHGRVALGTDSRLSGGRDMLDEMRVAAQIADLDARTLQRLATRDSARLLRLPDRGELRVGARADILILPAAAPPGAATRADIRLVLIAGSVRYGDRHYAQRVDSAAVWTDVCVDGTAKILDAGIAASLGKIRAHESGLELPKLAWRAA